MEEIFINPETGEILRREYPADNDEGIFSQEDLKISDAALKYLKSVVEEKLA